MLFFKKRYREKYPDEPSVQDRVAKAIAGILLSIQSRFSRFMNERTKKLNLRTQKLFLVLFCLIFGGFSLYAFVDVFRNSEMSTGSLKPDQVSMPKYYPEQSQSKHPFVSEMDMIRISRFKLYMDNLSNSIKGKHVYDSILQVRPGLMDSIQVIEELYYSPSK